MKLILSLHRGLIILFYVLAVLTLVGLLGFILAGGSLGGLTARLDWNGVFIILAVVALILIFGACAALFGERNLMPTIDEPPEVREGE